MGTHCKKVSIEFLYFPNNLLLISLCQCLYISFGSNVTEVCKQYFCVLCLLIKVTYKKTFEIGSESYICSKNHIEASSTP